MSEELRCEGLLSIGVAALSCQTRRTCSLIVDDPRSMSGIRRTSYCGKNRSAVKINILDSRILTGRVDLYSRVGMNTQETKYEPVACSETKTRQCRGKQENEIKMRERTP